MGVTFCLFDFEVRSLVVIIFHIFITMYSYDGKVLGLWNLLSVLGLWNLLSYLNDTINRFSGLIHIMSCV